MIEAYLADWFSVIVRWLHLITGIAWIGASLHFIWLDNSLEEAPEDKRKDGVKGELWSIHGGGIYNFNKYALAPPTWPRILHWSKWEAYTTWITGMLLMIAVYYVQSTTYLVGQDKWIDGPGIAVLASLGFLVSGVIVYEALVRSPLSEKPVLFVVLLAAFVLLQCWLSTRLFSDRAAFLHVGALLGSIMAGNVFLGIIPAQKKFVAAVQAGEEPDADAAAFAKKRSTHNNYFTLPVLFCMISNHYPFLYGHPQNYLVLTAIIAITAYARHFFNVRHRGVTDYWILVNAFAGFLALALWLGYDKLPKFENSTNDSAEVEVVVNEVHAKGLIEKHCRNCHSANPTQPGFLAPPAGVLMDDPGVYLASRISIISAMRSNYMPLGNMTGMTEAERKVVVDWLENYQEKNQ